MLLNMNVYKKFLVYLLGTTYIGVFYLRIFHYTFIYEQPLQAITGSGRVCLISAVLYIIVSIAQKKVLNPFIRATQKAKKEKRNLTEKEIDQCLKSYRNFDINIAITEFIGFVIGSGASVLMESATAPEPFSPILIILIILQSIGFGFLNFVIISFCIKKMMMAEELKKLGVKKLRNSLANILTATVICIIYLCIMNTSIVSIGVMQQPRPNGLQIYGAYLFIASILTVAVCYIAYILLVKRMQKNELNASKNLHEATKSLAEATRESASTSQDQSAAVKEIVATMEDSNTLNSTIDRSVRNVSDLANKSKNDVISGVACLNETIQGLIEIMESNKSTIDGIKNLSIKIDHIWDIVSLINDIADTAKIIAFNAELEASAAGESGKNFHIVATEVRRLSDNIIDGTHEIKVKIDEIQKASDFLIKTSSNETIKIEEEYTTARNLETKFESIRTSSETTAKQSGEIIGVIKQLETASEQILLTLKQISGGIENISLTNEHISNSSEIVRQIASEL